MSEEDANEVAYESGMPIRTSLQVGLSEDERQAQLEMAVPMPFVIQTYGLISVSAQDFALFIQNEQTEKMMIKQDSGESTTLANYSLSYSEPVYSMEQTFNYPILLHLKHWIHLLIVFYNCQIDCQYA